MLDKDQLRKHVEDVIDRRFDNLISNRAQWEENAANKIISIAQGSAPAPHKSVLVKIYTNLNDPTLPSMFRKTLAKETAWIDKDFFRWTPDGIESTDIEGTYWITDWQKDNLNNELSNFHSAIRAAIHQTTTLNLGAYAYSWYRKPKTETKYLVQNRNGMSIASGKQEVELPLEYDMQGIKFEFVNILNYYPDIITDTTFENTRKLDGYYRYYPSLADIKADRRFNPEQPYEFDVNVIYRGLDFLSDLNKNESVAYSQATVKLNKYLNQDAQTNERERNKQVVEVRIAYLKEIRIDGESYTADGRGFRIEYIKQGKNCLPLLIEENPFIFEQKPIRLTRRWSDPNIFYNDSELGMMVNQHNYLIYSKQMQASALVKATNPTQILSTKILEAFQGAKDKIAKILTEPGGIEFVDLASIIGNDPLGLEHLKPLTLGTVEENLKNLDLFQRAIDQCKADIAQANVQVTDQMGAGATAAFNKQVAQEQDLLSREFKATIVRDLIQPALEYGLKMAKVFFQPQKMTVRMGADDKKYLQKALGAAKREAMLEDGEEVPDNDSEMPWEEVKQLSAEKGATIPKVAKMGAQNQLITYNPVTEKKQAIITKALFENTPCSFKLEIEDNEYSKQQVLEEVVQIYGNIIANTPDSPLKYLVSKLAIQKTLQATDDSSYAEIMEEAEKLYQQMIAPPQPSPEEQMNAEAQAQKTQADAMQKQATAEKQTAEANKINQEVQDNELAKQLVGVG